MEMRICNKFVKLMNNARNIREDMEIGDNFILIIELWKHVGFSIGGYEKLQRVCNNNC